MLSKISSLALFGAAVKAHYFLNTPPSIGFDDTTLTTAPCGGFDPTDRSGGATDWPVTGYPFSVITTHLDVVWTFKAALTSNGAVEFCLPALPGVQDWIGRDAVFQAVQKAPDGDLHRCTAIRFVASGSVPLDDCNNSTNVRATIVPETGPKPPVTLDPFTSTSTTTPPQTTEPLTTTTTSEPEPTQEPTTEPTVEPINELTTEATTSEPTTEPTAEPTTEPTTEPTSEPTDEPRVEPTSTADSTHGSTDHHHPTTTGGYHHGTTDTPGYTDPGYTAPPNPTLSTTVSSNTTSSLPPPPTYTGGASSLESLGVTFILVISVALWAF
ncbi:uncharacterized protein DFL_007565 [Arthrobotrys flagrans]|uniref:Copper acquisition factor BIM1-like domain-containing protein n=1 Tax=Arthrobotrys flagrans TaxID=97331 RepID=A0A436ZWP9_ARTFL|nr:hypothetical protein DFL_007565 [Arthrobotrys flagrans]